MVFKVDASLHNLIMETFEHCNLVIIYTTYIIETYFLTKKFSYDENNIFLIKNITSHNFDNFYFYNFTNKKINPWLENWTQIIGK